MIEQLGLKDIAPISSPGTDVEEPQTNSEEDAVLDPVSARLYRGIAARCNYLSDTPELQFSVKEACREMSTPTAHSWNKLVRIGRYLKGQPRLEWFFPLPSAPNTIDRFVDSSWAGCRRTRKNTSGGIIRYGKHVFKTWSKTQATIAGSSAEAESYGIGRGSTEGLGVITLCEDVGIKTQARVHVDANAAKEIVEREGLGKVRHVEVDVLWLQEQQARARLPLHKCEGTWNPADLMTNSLPRAGIQRHINFLGMVEAEGRSAKAAQLHAISTSIDEVVSQGNDGYDADSWEARGQEGKWIRQHTTPRRALFTPYRMPPGPPNNQRLKMSRRTIGDLLTGGKFDISDDWTSGSQAHRFLKDAWTGRTEFEVIHDK